MNDSAAPGTSLERVLAVLDVFSEERPEWTPEEMMETLGYSRPTLYRYLKTLREAGLLTSTSSASFTLGPRIVEMDYLLRKSDPLILNGARHLQALTAAWRCTALLVRWYGGRILCVDSACSTENPATSYTRGRPMALGRGAVSHSIMAFLPRRQMIRAIERHFADLSAVGLGSDAGEIRESFRKMRAKGYAVAHGEVTPGVIGIGAPVFDAGLTPVASLCVTIADAGVDDALADEIGATVRAAAGALSRELSLHRN